MSIAIAPGVLPNMTLQNLNFIILTQLHNHSLSFPWYLFCKPERRVFCKTLFSQILGERPLIFWYLSMKWMTVLFSIDSLRSQFLTPLNIDLHFDM